MPSLGILPSGIVIPSFGIIPAGGFIPSGGIIPSGGSIPSGIALGVALASISTLASSVSALLETQPASTIKSDNTTQNISFLFIRFPLVSFLFLKKQIATTY